MLISENEPGGGQNLKCIHSRSKFPCTSSVAGYRFTVMPNDRDQEQLDCLRDDVGGETWQEENEAIAGWKDGMTGPR